jgi:hypothetical protein
LEVFGITEAASQEQAAMTPRRHRRLPMRTGSHAGKTQHVSGYANRIVVQTYFLGLPAPPPYTKPELMESVACLWILLLPQIATGWIAARTHRAAAIPMVVVFVTWLTLWLCGSLSTSSEAERLLLNSIDQSRFRPYLAWYLTPIAVEIVGLLCGGILGSPPKRRQTPLQSCSRDS